MSEINEALKKLKTSFKLKGGTKGTYYIEKVGKDTNGNHTYMIAKGANKAKKIQHQGEWGSKFMYDDDEIDSKTEKGIIEYYEEFINESDEEYDKFVQDTLKDKGYDSVADIPKDEIDDFWIEIDKGYNAENEPGKDGVNEAYGRAMIAHTEGDTAKFLTNIDEMLNITLAKNETFKEHSDIMEAYGPENIDEAKSNEEKLLFQIDNQSALYEVLLNSKNSKELEKGIIELKRYLSGKWVDKKDTPNLGEIDWDDLYDRAQKLK